MAIKKTNILVLSAGRRNKIIQCLKMSLGDRGKVFSADCSNLAPALYDAQDGFITPMFTESSFLDTVLDICNKNNIKAVFSLIDPELSFLAKNKDKFLKVGIIPFVSDYYQVETALNKLKMYDFCVENRFASIPTYSGIDAFKEGYFNKEIKFPVFVKPKCGSCSNNINRIDSMAELIEIVQNNDELIIQEYINGQEIGVDVYIDILSKEPVSIFSKKKLLMRAGETDRSVSFIDKKLIDFVSEFVKKAGFIGTIDIDIFEKNGEYLISEVNPRFGGGYPHAYACGCDFFQMMINNVNGIVNKPNIGEYEENVYMMKYLECIFKRESELK